MNAYSLVTQNCISFCVLRQTLMMGLEVEIFSLFASDAYADLEHLGGSAFMGAI